jgi:hypothetical protein
MLITREDPVRHRAVTGCGLCEYVGCFVVFAQHMMKLEAVELSLSISYSLTVRRILRVHAVFVLHDLIHDQLRDTPNLKALDAELDNDSETIDQSFVLHGVVRCREV